jgi:hypothetical protein
METILDTGGSWFLERLLFADGIKIYIVEGVKSAHPQTLNIAGIDLGTAYSTDITDASRHCLVSFKEVLAYQVTSESLTTGDENDVGDTGVLRSYDRSAYQDFVRSSSLIDSLRPGTYTHYRLVLVDDVVDVIAEREPTVENLAAPENRSNK